MSWNRFDLQSQTTPKKGCSIAFYIMLIALLVIVLIMFIQYKATQQ